MELNESEPAKLRLSSSSLSSSNESLKNENKISTTESSETQNVINRISKFKRLNLNFSSQNKSI